MILRANISKMEVHGMESSQKSIKGFNLIFEFSRGEICVGNFIPPENGASLGSY